MEKNSIFTTTKDTKNFNMLSDILNNIRRYMVVTNMLARDAKTTLEVSNQKSKDMTSAFWTFVGHHKIVVDLSNISETEKIIKSLVYHEVGHSLFTEKNISKIVDTLKENNVSFSLFNLLEDARIENLIRKKYNYTFDWTDSSKYGTVDSQLNPLNIFYSYILSENNFNKSFFIEEKKKNEESYARIGKHEYYTNLEKELDYVLKNGYRNPEIPAIIVYPPSPNSKVENNYAYLENKGFTVDNSNCKTLYIRYNKNEEKKIVNNTTALKNDLLNFLTNKGFGKIIDENIKVNDLSLKVFAGNNEIYEDTYKEKEEGKVKTNRTHSGIFVTLDINGKSVDILIRTDVPEDVYAEWEKGELPDLSFNMFRTDLEEKNEKLLKRVWEYYEESLQAIDSFEIADLAIKFAKEFDIDNKKDTDNFQENNSGANSEDLNEEKTSQIETQEIKEEIKNKKDDKEDEFKRSSFSNDPSRDFLNEKSALLRCDTFSYNYTEIKNLSNRIKKIILNKEKVNVISGGKKINVRNYIQNKPKIFRKNIETHSKDNYFTLVLDASGSMEDIHDNITIFDNGKKFILILNDLCNSGFIKGNVIISSTYGSYNFKLPLSNEVIKKLSTVGGEGFDVNFTKYESTLVNSDKVFVFTDGCVTPPSKHVISKIKEKMFALYVGSRDQTKRLLENFPNAISEKSLEDAVLSLIKLI